MNKKQLIRKNGKELFSKKGYKDANIADIMELAGFATGTFYNYYSSKDHLFMDIFIEENRKLKEAIVKEVNFKDEPVNIIKEMMILNYQGMLANPVLKEWYNKEVFTKIEKHFHDENGLESVDFLYDIFLEVVKKWQKEQKMRSDIDAEMIMAIFSAMINVELHKEEIGIKFFPKLLEYMSDFIMAGLMDCTYKKQYNKISDQVDNK